MGQANLRGTFEQRKTSAIIEAIRTEKRRAAEKKAQEKKQADEWNSLTTSQQQKRVFIAGLMASVMTHGNTAGINFESELFDVELKGIKDGNCNVTDCQKPGATYYNKSTKKYYCKACAEMINWEGGRKDVMELYGVPLLCEPDA